MRRGLVVVDGIQNSRIRERRRATGSSSSSSSWPEGPFPSKKEEGNENWKKGEEERREGLEWRMDSSLGKSSLNALLLPFKWRKVVRKDVKWSRKGSAITLKMYLV